MITILDPIFWFYFLVFILAVISAFFIPGDLPLRKLNLSFFQRVVIGTVVGMVLWAWQGFLFGYLGLRYLTYGYLFITFISWIYLNRKTLKNFRKRQWFSIKKIDLVIVFSIIIGMFIQLVPVGGFGLEYSKGIYLCCGNRDDLVFHAALTSQIVQNMPPYEPGMAGVLVKNYHYWSNLVAAELIRVFKLPLFYVQFQYTNFFISLFLGLSTLAFAGILNISRAFTRWLVFLFYFGGDAIFLMLLFLGKNLSDLKLVSSLEDGSTFLINPPRTFSIVIVLVGLSLFATWFRQKKLSAGILSIVLLASTIGFKVYTGIFALSGVSVLIAYFFYKKRFKELLISSLIYPLSAIIYLSNNSSAGGLFWAPFNLSNNFIVQPAFGLEKLELARQVFLSHKNFLRVLQHDLLSAAVFFITLCGTKLLALFQSVKSFLQLGKELALFLLAGLITSLFIGMFFLQESGGSNSFNFVVSFWLFLSIPTALALDYLLKKFTFSWAKIFFITLVIILTIPRIINNTFLNISEYKQLGYLLISDKEIKAFNFLRNRDKVSTIIVDPNLEFDQYSPLVSAFTQQSMFLSGENILVSHGADIKQRRISQDRIFRSNIPTLGAGELLDNNIDYILLWDKSRPRASESAYFTKIVFSNQKITILEVDREKLKSFPTQNLERSN